ncbi:DUF2244 domain-containing protein [Poseidonocella sp. HB161398]|uniref:DUF2244 domain-containing protein n=1 Tax=Poseidonocella sp. HB161398 TaxID=2320855 RepID=UPI001108C2C1|nr:DUF2244 domain-containing protein [Poseidonocella sp. HB161398]
MPWHWDTGTQDAPVITGASYFSQGDPPLARLSLSAHSSLTRKGFAVTIAAASAMVLVPLLTVLGSSVFWVLLLFIAAAIGGLWRALTWSWADRAVTEELAVWTDSTCLSHRPGRGTGKSWQANTYWLAAHLHPRRGGHRNYITLTGSADGREVELGSFLTETERAALYPVLRRLLDTAAASAMPP